MKTKLRALWCLLSLGTSLSFAQFTAIPDTNFELELISRGLDSGPPNGQVPTANISNVTSLQLQNINFPVADLTGIQDFTQLQTLVLDSYTGSSLNVSNNINLQVLRVEAPLINLELPTSSSITELVIRQSQLTGLDLTAEVNLDELEVLDGPLTSLNLPPGNIFRVLDIRNSNLQFVDLSVAPALEIVTLLNNDLKAIDVSNLTDLRILSIGGNDLKGTLDVSANPVLRTLAVNPNNLNAINMDTGCTANSVEIFNASNNPINCIRVNDQNNIPNNWSFPTSATVSETCIPVTLVPDANFEQELIDLNIDSDGIVNGEVPTSDISGITNLDVRNESISDLTGIQDFAALTRLVVRDNPLTSLDVSSNQNLEILNAIDCNIANVGLPTSNTLFSLQLQGNNLNTLNLSGQSALVDVTVQDNQLMTLDLSAATALETIQAQRNNLTSISFAPNLSTLTDLRLFNNVLTTLDVRTLLANNTNLNSFFAVGNNQLSGTLDLSNLTFPNQPAIQVQGNNYFRLNLRGITVTSSFFTIDIRNNSNFYCIQVDDPANPPFQVVIQKDPQAQFSTDCVPRPTINYLGQPGPLATGTTLGIEWDLAITGFDVTDLNFPSGTLSNFAQLGASASSPSRFSVDIDFPSSLCNSSAITIPANSVTTPDGTANDLFTLNFQPEDTTPPNAVVQNVTVQLDASGQGSLTAAAVDAGTTDNCGVGGLSIDRTQFTCVDLGVNTVTFTVTDISGNTDTAQAQVTVEDNVPLTVVAQDITVQLDANGQAAITTQDIDNGSSSGCGNFTLSLDITTFDCTNLGTNTVTLTATEGSNTVTDTAIVTVTDTADPVAVGQDITVQLDATGNATISIGDIENGSTDNCGIVSSSLDITTFDCSTIGTNTVRLTVTDASNNSGIDDVTVTVTENVAPFAIAQDILVQLDASGNVSVTPQQVGNGSTDNCSVASLSLDQTDFTCADLGQNTVVLTVTDTSGNTDTATATVTVQEDPNQQLTAVAQDITIQLDANGQATITPQDVNNGSGSGCGNITLSLDIDAFDCTNLGANTVTLTVTEGPNSQTDTATVTVVDALDPSVLTQDITVQLDANGQASIVAADIDNGSTDNCAIASTTLDITSFDCAAIGANTVTLTVIDTEGNSATATAQVTVSENVVPTAVAQDVIVQLDSTGNASITAQQIDNGSTDNCSVAALSLDQTDFSCADLGQNTVTLTVTDTSGNTDTATATVTVEENPNQSLTAITQDITVQLDANGAVTITPQDVDNGSGSGCNSTPNLSLDVSSFDCSSLGQNIVTLTATEGSVSATATAIVTVEDTLAPDILVQDITVDINPNGIASITVADVDNGTTDNCTPLSGLTLSLDNRDFSCSELGENTVTLTAIDGNGNSGTATAIVTVQDTTLPTVVTQDIQVSLDANGNASITPEQINNGSSDGCSGVDTLSLDVTTFSCPSLGNVTVTLTVTDASGNSATGTATVNITAEDLDGNGIADACENQELVVSKGFSPNGDNRNDTWTVENIEDYPNARVSVFNRWGEKVYEQVGYQNDWDAVSNQISTSRRLPAGSYLYIIETNNPEVPPMRGWMYINY
ncbi:MAG: gliding motility-associated C-terminal domain-containing protein [Croceivirga sp.]